MNLKVVCFVGALTQYALCILVSNILIFCYKIAEI